MTTTIDDVLATWTAAERTGDARGEPTIAGMQYSFIGPPLGAPR